MDVNTFGMVIAAVSVVSSGMQQIMCGTMQRKHGLSSHQLLSNTAPMQARARRTRTPRRRSRPPALLPEQQHPPAAAQTQIITSHASPDTLLPSPLEILP